MQGIVPGMKALVRRTVNRLGYDLVRYEEPFDHPLNVLRLAVRDHLARDGHFFFVQVGANDGVRSDQLRPLVMEYRLSGLLVEPLPDQFARLVRNYADQPQLRFANCAVAEADGTRELFRVRLDAPVPDWAHGLASFHRSHLATIPGINQYLERVTVPTRTMTSLLAEHAVRAVTLLQVDVEGFDYQVIRLTFAAGCFPEMIYYEHCHLTPPEKLACRRLLKQHGYRFADLGRDTLAMRDG